MNTPKDEEAPDVRIMKSKVKDHSPAPMKKYNSDGTFVAIKTTTSKSQVEEPSTNVTPRKRIRIPSAKKSPLSTKRFTREDINTIAKIRNLKVRQDVRQKEGGMPDNSEDSVKCSFLIYIANIEWNL